MLEVHLFKMSEEIKIEHPWVHEYPEIHRPIRDPAALDTTKLSEPCFYREPPMVEGMGTRHSRIYREKKDATLSFLCSPQARITSSRVLERL